MIVGIIFRITAVIRGTNEIKFKICNNFIAFFLPSITGSVFNHSLESFNESYKSKKIAFIIPFIFIKMNTIINGSERVKENWSGTKSVPPNDQVNTV